MGLELELFFLKALFLERLHFLHIGQRQGCGEVVPDTAGGRRTLVWSPLQRCGNMWTLYGRSRGGLGDSVSSRGAASGMRGRLD